MRAGGTDCIRFDAGNERSHRPGLARRTTSRVKLPHAKLAVVPERKITRYLLNPAHPAGGSKAALFLRFGFTRGGLDATCRHLAPARPGERRGRNRANTARRPLRDRRSNADTPGHELECAHGLVY